MSAGRPSRVVVVGAGPAGVAALGLLPGAVSIARPRATAWHAEPGRLWVEGDGRVWAEPFDALLVCADEPLLLAALGCAVSGGRVVVDGAGRTSVAGILAAGRVTGAEIDEEAQGRTAARALLDGGAVPAQPGADAAPAARVRLDPLEIAALLEQPAGALRNAAALAQVALLGPLVPARPVGLATLADLAAEPPEALPPQPDRERLA